MSKSNAVFLFRCDDASLDFNETKWIRLAKIFDKYSVKPMFAIIPENRDTKISYTPPDDNRWELFRNWISNGWAPALHGFQHKFHNINRLRLAMPFYDRSEFAGLSLECQKTKIKSGLKILSEQSIYPEIFVAPAHSFDKNTLHALMSGTSIKYVSDTIAFTPYRYRALKMIPQQLWLPVDKKNGVWTICLHPNTMQERDYTFLELWIKRNQSNIINFEDIKNYQFKDGKSISDLILTLKFWIVLYTKRLIIKLV